MVELVKRKVEGKPTEITIDERTIENKKNKRNVKSLKYARNLPVQCNICPYRAENDGGNGFCSKYERDAICVIRKDISKQVEKFNERNEGKILAMMESAFTDDWENLQFHEAMEQMGGIINPEVTRRRNSIANLGKIISEIKTKRETVEVKQTRISKGKMEEIAQMISITKESAEDV